EPLDAKSLDLLAPGPQALFPALESTVGWIAVLPGEIGTHPDHRLEGHRFGDHVVPVAPGLAPDALGGLEEISHHAVVARDLLAAASGDLDAAPVAIHPAVQLVEQLRLQDPLVLLAAPAQAVDAIAQRAVPLAVQAPDQPGGELAVRLRPGHALV